MCVTHNTETVAVFTSIVWEVSLSKQELVKAVQVSKSCKIVTLHQNNSWLINQLPICCLYWLAKYYVDNIADDGAQQ